MRIRTQHWSIRTQTLFLALTPACLMLALLLGGFLYSRYQDLQQQMFARGQLMARQLAPACEYPLISGNVSLLEGQFKVLLAEEDLVSVRLFDNHNKLLFERSNVRYSGLSDNRTFTADVAQSLLILDSDSGFLDDNPVPSKILGRVEISLSAQPYWQRQKAALWVSILLALVALILTAYLAKLMARNVLKPLTRLTTMVKTIGQGQFELVTLPSLGGELGVLEQDIAGMASRLAQAQSNARAYLLDLERASQEAQKANKAKGEFLANMSHELRTPMNGTLGMLQLLRDSQLQPQQQNFVDTAIESTEHLLRVINDILDFSKIEEGRLSIEHIAFDPIALVQRVVQGFELDAKHKDLLLSLVVAAQPLEPLWLYGDPTRLRQVLVNLLGNAIKFTHRGCVIVDLSLKLQPAEQVVLQLNVTDTGIGISPEQQQRIFDAFQQADGSTQRRYGGTGLGLAIVRRLVNLMGGRLELKSEALKGSKFAIELPLTRAPAVEAPKPELFVSQPVRQFSGHILLVEDNQVNQLVAKSLLQKLGLQVDTAADGQIAVTRVKNCCYDLILMDCQMPNMDGFEATQQIHSLPSHRAAHPPIIALTANAMEGDRERCLAAGMDDYLSKPLKKELLVEKLQLWLP